jgi:predicted transcriptional regulator
MSEELTNGIYVSINPEPTSKIVQGIKNHEFRNYIPKNNFKFMYVYVTAPQSQLKYVIEIGDIVKYPEQLENDGDGNYDFNIGNKSKYAYPIIKVYELASPISLQELKNKFGFVPPQAFSYAETFAKLTEYVSKAEKTIIIEPRL